MRLLLISILTILLMGVSIEDARKANEAYNNGEYQKAITLYKKAIDAEPKNSKLYFNLATALAKTGQRKEAIRTYEQYKSMTKDPQQQARADYNIGNLLAQEEQWEQAAERYRQSLRYMNQDSDAKHNYELAKQKEQQQKKQQQQKQQNNNQQNQQNQQQSQNQQQQNQQQKNKQQQQSQQNSQNQQNQQNQSNQSQQKQQSRMSKAEAEKILEALGQREKELLKQFKKQKSDSDNSTNEKDW